MASDWFEKDTFKRTVQQLLIVFVGGADPVGLLRRKLQQTGRHIMA